MRSILSFFKRREPVDDGIRYHHLAETDSTNRYCQQDLATQAAPEVAAARLAVVTTDYQSAGRGCGSNSWESERGANLLFSIVCHPTWVPVVGQFVVSECVALAIRDALSEKVGDVTIKWPNDIYHKDSKICGILIENHLAGRQIKDCVIGVGLNVNQRNFVSDAPNPVSLYQILGHETDREPLLRDIVKRFDDYLTLTRSARYGGISAAYFDCLYRRHGFHPYRDVDGKFEAALLEVEDDGHLILRDRGGMIRSYAFKEVEFII